MKLKVISPGKEITYLPNNCEASAQAMLDQYQINIGIEIVDRHAHLNPPRKRKVA